MANCTSYTVAQSCPWSFIASGHLNVFSWSTLYFLQAWSLPAHFLTHSKKMEPSYFSSNTITQTTVRPPCVTVPEHLENLKIQKRNPKIAWHLNECNHFKGMYCKAVLEQYILCAERKMGQDTCQIGLQTSHLISSISPEERNVCIWKAPYSVFIYTHAETPNTY